MNSVNLTQREIELLKFVENIKYRIWKHIVQVLDDKRRLTPVGSGVLVRQGKRLFIFSAYHVMKDVKGRKINLAVRSEDECFNLLGEAYLNSLGEPYDASVMMLPSNYPDLLQERAIDLESIDDSETISNHEEHHHALFGFPANRTSIYSKGTHIENKNEREVFVYKEAENQKYKEIPNYQGKKGLYNKNLHLVLECRPYRTSLIETKYSLKLSGASGGGIFRTILSPTPKLRLAAIFTEKHSRPSVLVGTRITHHVAIARNLLSRFS